MRLQHRGFRLLASGGSASVEIALSENLVDFVWIARVHLDSITHVAIVNFPRNSLLPTYPANTTISLERRFLWAQDNRMLDFAVLSKSTAEGATFVVLEPERLVFYKGANPQLAPVREFAIAHPKPWPRDVRGRLDAENGAVTLPELQCTGAFANPGSFQCFEAPGGKESNTSIAGTTISFEGHDVEAARLHDTCGVGSLTLASGTGDWTVPDTIQAYVEADHQYSRMGKALDIPGPILALWNSSDPNSVRVISQNVQTGMYEASIVSVSCNR